MESWPGWSGGAVAEKGVLVEEEAAVADEPQYSHFCSDNYHCSRLSTSSHSSLEWLTIGFLDLYLKEKMQVLIVIQNTSSLRIKYIRHL